jgi:hypothetical protein
MMSPPTLGGVNRFIINGSLAWILSTAPEPKYEPDTEPEVPTGIYGAVGNQASCTAQGFFFQLGYTGIFYNMVLTIHYVLVIKYGMRERRLFQLRWFFHVPVLVAGFGLALAGIPFYEYIVLACHIPPPPLVDSSTLITIFSVVPISIVCVVSTINMAIIYWHVRKQDRTANRWRFSSCSAGEASSFSGVLSTMVRKLSFLSSSSSSAAPAAASSSLTTPTPTPTPPPITTRHNTNTNRLSNTVWWQAILYVSSFLLTWPIFFVANFNPTRVDYAFWVVVVILNPLQGFWNCVIYFRPRLSEHWIAFRSKRRVTRNKAKKTTVVSDTTPAEEDDGDQQEEKEGESGGFPHRSHQDEGPGGDNEAGIVEECGGEDSKEANIQGV